MLGRSVSFPIMFILPFSFLDPSAFMQNLKRVDYWTAALLLTATAVADDLIVEYGQVDRDRERRNVKKRPEQKAETCPSSHGPSIPKPG